VHHADTAGSYAATYTYPPQQHRTNTRHSDIIKIICAVVLPPLGVFLERGCGADLLINLLLTILGCKSLPPDPASLLP